MESTATSRAPEKKRRGRKISKDSLYRLSLKDQTKRRLRTMDVTNLGILTGMTSEDFANLSPVKGRGRMVGPDNDEKREIVNGMLKIGISFSDGEEATKNLLTGTPAPE